MPGRLLGVVYLLVIHLLGMLAAMGHFGVMQGHDMATMVKNKMVQFPVMNGSNAFFLALAWPAYFVSVLIFNKDMR